jgi:hypothetical protein
MKPEGIFFKPFSILLMSWLIELDQLPKSGTMIFFDRMSKFMDYNIIYN